MVDMTGGGQLGDVSVEVRADLDKLLTGFNRAKAETRGFERDMNRVTKSTNLSADAERRLHGELLNLARAYDPVHAAALRYQTDLTRIRALERAAIVDQVGAARLRAGAKASYDQAAGGIQAVGLASRFAGPLVAALGTSLVVGLVNGLRTTVVESLKASAAIGDFARQVGLSTDEVQEYRGIAAQLGMTQEDVNGAFKQLDETISDAAAGLDRPKKLFDMLGISLTDAGGKAKTNGQIFLELIDKLGQVGNEAERAAGLAVAFGDQYGPKMKQAVDIGSKGIDDLREAYRALGLVLSEEEIQKSDETAKKMEQLQLVLDHEIAKVTIDNADAVLQFETALAKLKAIGIKNLAEDINAFALAGKALTSIPGIFNNISASIPPMVMQMLQSIPVLGQFIALMRALGSLGPAAGAVRGFNVPGRSVTVPLGAAKKPEDPKGKGGGGGNISLAGLLDRKTGGGRKGGGGGRAVENVFDREELRSREENLRLLRERTGSLQEQNRIDKELIDIDLAQRVEQIDSQAKRKSLTAAQAAKLKLEAQNNAEIEKELADRRMRVEMIERSYRLSDEMLALESDGLDLEHRLARTDEERRRLELLILSNKQQQARNEIEKSIALAEEAGDQDRITELVEQRRKLIENQNAEIKAFNVEHLTGFAKFKNDLPRTVDEINEQIDRIRFDRFLDKLRQAADFTDDIGAAFGRFADPQQLFKNPLKAFQSFVADLTDIFNRNFIQKPIEEWAKRAIGAPLAKQAFGKGLMKDGGLNTEQMNIALGIASNNLNMLAQAAAMASANLGGAAANPFNPGGGGMFDFGGGFGGEDVPDFVLPEGTDMGGMFDFADTFGEAVDFGLDPFTTATQSATQALNEQVPIIGQFGGGLMQILGSLAGGGGGGGGFLGSLLNIAGAVAGAAFGGGGGPAPGTFAGVSFGSNLGVGSPGPLGMADGGWRWGHGGPRGDKLPTWLSDGEFVVNAHAANRPGVPEMLESINAGRLPQMRPGPLLVDGGRKTEINLGGVTLNGVRDDRSARRSARQFDAEVQRRLSYVNRSGLNK